MTGAERLAQGDAVTLDDMLAAREQRVARQRQALVSYRQPLISLTLVSPGAVKNGPAWRALMAIARREIRARCQQQEWVIVGESATDDRCGPEWIVAVCAGAKTLKQVMVALEQQHPLGRLWDIDVIDTDGRAISRQALGFAGRQCLICNDLSHACARSRRHALPELLDEIARRIERYERDDW